MPAVVTFGEALLRLSPPASERLEQARSLQIWPGGAELNVAVGLARLGTDVAFVSRLPRNALGRLVAAHAQGNGVDTSGVRWSEEGRLGLYFLEPGEPPRATSALYDRAGSAFALLDPEEFDWLELLDGARAFHTTGITAALSDGCAVAVENALTAARDRGCVTSYDLNFRSRLSSPARAAELLGRLAPLVDLLVVSSTDAETVFGLNGDAVEVASALRERFAAGAVVVSARVARPEGMQARLSAAVGERTEVMESPAFGTVDPIGGGDAFCAGLLHGVVAGDVRLGLELGGAMAALKQSIPGDAPLVDRDEIELVLSGTQARMSR